MVPIFSGGFVCPGHAAGNPPAHSPSSTCMALEFSEFCLVFHPGIFSPAVTLIPLATSGFQPPDLWVFLPRASWISHVIQHSLSCWESGLPCTSKSQTNTQLSLIWERDGGGGCKTSPSVEGRVGIAFRGGAEESVMWPLACCCL